MKVPFANSTFKLDVSGIGGFFAGEESVAAMSSIHLVPGRKWLGWYNSPGSYLVARKYGALALSVIQNWGVREDPTMVLGLDGKYGPSYIAAHSDSHLSTTGHFAYLFTGHCNNYPGPIHLAAQWPSSTDLFLTIAEFNDSEDFEGYPHVPMKPFSHFDYLAIVPIGYSVGACVASAVFRDWICFALILLGILCNGFTCIVIGTGVLKIIEPFASRHSPPGDGILTASPRFVIVKGNPQSIMRTTRGRFDLRYSPEQYRGIGVCAVILMIQFLIQLFVVPQGTLFGQIMFLSSLGASWLYNFYLASINSESVQASTLVNKLLQKPKIHTVRLSKYTSLVVFSAVYMQVKDPRRFFDQMLPNNTALWTLMKEIVVQAISKEEDPRSIGDDKLENINSLNEADRGLLEAILQQASNGYRAAKEYNRDDAKSSISNENIIPPAIQSSMNTETA